MALVPPSGTHVNPDSYAFAQVNGKSLLINCNQGFPLDPTRLGSFTGTGAVVNVAVPSISANSQVRVAFVGGLLPGAAPVIVVTANVGFSHNAAAGAIYNYEVVG